MVDTTDSHVASRSKDALWARLAELVNPEHLAEFVTVHDGIEAYHAARLSDSTRDAYERGANFQHALSADSYTSGAVDIARMLCEQHGCPVPQWIADAAAQLAARQEAMVAAVQASAERRALAAFVQESPVH